ncbi:hypothetical protein [Kitasatospora purpeofusca]|uniref:hypothetical protein n=1 Tax=Kitasatospora purpeofusca TaxID=67352 RepID=UPI003668FA95
MRTFIRSLFGRLGYVKASEVVTISEDQAEQLRAAEAFVENWTNSGLASTLIEDYTCTLGCSEAETYADVFRAFGYYVLAEDIVHDHAEYDECGDAHHICGLDCIVDDEDPFELAA